MQPRHKCRPGTVIARQPYGRITDWDGQCIDPKIRGYFQPGNVVRVGGDAYIRILRVCKKSPDYFYGIVDDPYCDDFTWHQNGEQVTFHRRDVTEVPLAWKGNKNLAKKAKLRPFGSAFTGVGV